VPRGVPLQCAPRPQSATDGMGPPKVSQQAFWPRLSACPHATVKYHHSHSQAFKNTHHLCDNGGPKGASVTVSVEYAEAEHFSAGAPDNVWSDASS